MFTFTVTQYIVHLNNLKKILEKASLWQAEHKVSDEVMLGARLALDQYPLAQQIRLMTMFAANSGAHLCGIQAPVLRDTLVTMSDLHARIDEALAFLTTLTEEMVKDDLDTRLIPLSWMPGKGLTAKYYIENFGHANFFFHYTTAYAILRHYGITLGKGDYMGSLDIKDIQ